MHDGESVTFPDAIKRHSGEAAHITKKFEKLRKDEQDDIIEFLRSL